MECVFGLVGDGFALIAADSSAVNSILVHKSNEDKIMVLDSHKLLGASGEAGDRAQFTEYIQKNVHLYQFRNGIPLTTAAAANFTRGELATALRKEPIFCEHLLAGYDKEVGPSLYYIDYIATLHKLDKGAFGYGSYFSLSMMDRHYRNRMSLEQAIDLATSASSRSVLGWSSLPQTSSSRSSTRMERGSTRGVNPFHQYDGYVHSIVS
ncbi:Proteasome subunit beta type-2-A [Platanthera guangdongensis]|uniref:Proteasome subunit beta n=1 Tax=Platanthera guangdongensis TaxID=2320717 RepID=A0ABR2LQJ7_9ASPA